jgi:hypothetical protein
LADLDIDYVAVVDADSIEPLAVAQGNVLLAAAAHVGATRLIDNVKYRFPESAADGFPGSESREREYAISAQ